MRGSGTVIDEDESHRAKNKQNLKVLDGVAGNNFAIHNCTFLKFIYTSL